jgi:hypothetical protein
MSRHDLKKLFVNYNYSILILGYSRIMVSSHRLVIKDAAWQLIGRIISALFGFLTIKIMTPYL